MKSPFYFGKVASDVEFTDREKDVKRLKISVYSGINTILLSPRRWGKSSLVEKVASEIEKENKGYKICKLDLFKIHSEEEFYNQYMNKVLKASSGKWEEWIENSKKFLKSIVPYLSFGMGIDTEFKMSVSYNEIPKSKEDILLLPEKIAESKGVKFLICIDEFQNVSKFGKPIEFQEYLRAVFQYFKNTTFIIYGSKRHVLTELFNSQNMPFYKFGELNFLKKIDKKDWIPFIQSKFKQTGKSISKHLCGEICDLMQNHPYFVQQLSHHVWMSSEKAVSDSCLREGLKDMLEVNTILYIREIESLTTNQISFLRALVNEEEKLTSKRVIKEYDLGTSGNVRRMKESLANKEIVDFFEQVPIFNDPSFQIWLKREYFT